MADSNMSKRYLYIRWFLLRFGLVVYDIFAVNFAYFLALLVRFYVNYEFNIWAVRYVPAFLQFAPWYTICCLTVFGFCGLYKSLWRYASLSDMNRILLSGAITCGIQIIGTLLFVMRMPLTYYVLGAAFQFLFVTISRFSYRFVLIEKGRLSKWKYRKHAGVSVMVVGSGESSRSVIKHLERDPHNLLRPVCAVDFENVQYRGTMAGVPVLGGLDHVKSAVKKYKVERVILADSTMPAQIRKEIREICGEMDLSVQNFSEFFQSTSGKIPLRTMLEHVNGPIVIVCDGKEYAYDHPEQALNLFAGKKNVVSVSVRESTLRIEIMQDILLLNDTQEEWVEDYRKEAGEDISFF